MCTKIFEINEEGEIVNLATYSVEPKQALVCHLEQNYRNNYNTWDYNISKFLDEITPLKKSPNNYVYNFPNINSSIFTSISY